MGKVLSKGMSVAKRQINRYNVENRAHRVISKEKPTPAPMYPTDKKHLDQITRDHPEILEEHLRKDPVLQNRLKEVYVTSQDPINNIEEKVESKRSLPQDRRTPLDPEFGYYEPSVMPLGRFSLRQALKFIGDHQAEPNVWTVDAIAKEYKIEKNVLENVLKYFKTFQLYIPEKKDEKVQKVADSSREKASIEGK